MTPAPGALAVDGAGERLTPDTVERQREALDDGRVSAVELTRAALERAAALQPELGAFRVILAEEALAAAERADELLASSSGEERPLLGVPMVIKDDIHYAGQTTPFGCGGEHPVAEADSEVVRRLREAGAVIIGKTMAPEVGQWHFSESEALGAARNPWNPEHTPGGSSGGAAAAVAAGIVAAGVGSDGAGSIRIPAAWCGLVGLKPQRGRVSTWPEHDSFAGLACYGPLTRTVGDAALVMDAIAGNHPQDLYRPRAPALPYAESAARRPGALRIAVSFAVPFGISSELDPEVRAATEATAEQLAGLGHTVEAADLDYGMVGPALVPRGSGGIRDWCRRLESLDGLEQRTRTALRLARVTGAGPVVRLARRAEARIARRIGRAFERFDLVLTPTTAQPAPRVGALRGAGWWKTSTTASALCPYAFPWNVTGWPGLNVPAGRTGSGLPIGAQLLGPAHSEGTLLAVAGQLERAGGGEAA